MRALTSALLAVGLSLATPALAQETAPAPVDIGTIKTSDLKVVQNLLYSKEGRWELGGHLGLMVDQWLYTPNLQVTFDLHQSETFALSARVGGGWGFENATLIEVQGASYGVIPDAYRHLAHVLVGVQYAPFYAKVATNGKKIAHFDVYGSGRIGATLESSIIPQGGVTVAPTLNLGIGGRFFMGERGAIRVEVADDLLFQFRALTGDLFLKQNIGITVGYTYWSAPKQRSRR